MAVGVQRLRIRIGGTPDESLGSNIIFLDSESLDEFDDCSDGFVLSILVAKESEELGSCSSKSVFLDLDSNACSISFRLGCLSLSVSGASVRPSSPVVYS